ncbi:hypothetical protein [Spongiimicrobium salis]|uniref:hypothetical protein n=1 Tax=Spongiimicrobium salis TaxID=1667022 RepID=UPI00374CD52F
MDKFKEAVKNMRNAQKAYFKNRDSGNLNNAKFWETRVDDMIKADNEPTFFDQY